MPRADQRTLKFGEPLKRASRDAAFVRVRSRPSRDDQARADQALAADLDHGGSFGTLRCLSIDDHIEHLHIHGLPAYVVAINIGEGFPIEGWVDGTPVRTNFPAAAAGVLPPFHDFECRWAMGRHIRLLAVQMPAYYAHEALRAHPEAGYSSLFQPIVVADPALVFPHVARALINAMEQAEPSRVFVEHLAKAIAAGLWGRPAGKAAREAVVRNGLPPGTIRAIERYIDASLQEPPSLKAMAHVADLSVFHFARMFKQTTGATPHRYLIQARIKRATDLLSTTWLSVAGVAQEVGFSSQSQFAHYFRRWVGCTPREYRCRTKG